jgi:hypothetical protein
MKFFKFQGGDRASHGASDSDSDASEPRPRQAEDKSGRGKTVVCSARPSVSTVISEAPSTDINSQFLFPS